MLAALLGNPAFGPGVVDIYDISQDCRHPVLNSFWPVNPRLVLEASNWAMSSPSLVPERKEI